MRSFLMALAVAALSVPAGAQEAAPSAARGDAFDRLPYWPGYWVGESSIGTAISGIGRVAENRTSQTPPPSDTIAIWNSNAPWNEEGKRRVAEVAARQGGRKGMGWGFPLMMNSSTPVQFLITPEEVLIVNAYNEVRHIYADGRDHPPLDDLWPTLTGNSIGHWEGDTLVIDTIMVTNPNEFFQGNPPFSEEARYVERIRLDGERLLMTMTVIDPVTLAQPWVANMALVRETAFDRMIQVDWNNDRTGIEGNTNTIEPPKD
ncbi:hypothetical protein [Tsuneonella sp. HG222]